MPKDDILTEPYEAKRWKFEETGNWHKLSIPKNAVYFRIHNTETTAANRFWYSYAEDKNNEQYDILGAIATDAERVWQREDGFMPKEIWLKATQTNTWLWYEIWAPKK